MQYLIYYALVVLIAFWVGRRAARFGFSFWTYFLMSAILTPILGLVTLGAARSIAEEKERAEAARAMSDLAEPSARPLVSPEDRDRSLRPEDDADDRR